MKQALRGDCANGMLVVGLPAPSVRELAEQYDVSRTIAAQVLRELTEEGVLHTVPRVGTFVGAPVRPFSEDYLMLVPHDEHLPIQQRNAAMCAGFEERIAQLGGSALCLSRERARAAHASGILPPLAGVFELEWEAEETPFWVGNAAPVQRVRFRTGSTLSRYDTVAFDDVDGGRKATGHLVMRGHQRIAFLALHSQAHSDGHGEPLWSQEREDGWRQMLEGAGLDTRGLAFHPRQSGESLPLEQQRRVARESVAPLVRLLLEAVRPAITAVLAANDVAAQELLHALEAANVPLERWPSVVGFDDSPDVAGHLMTSLRLPWDDLGRAAANVLWKRRHGELHEVPHHERVPMKLISRLTCRREWPQSAAHAVFVTTP